MINLQINKSLVERISDIQYLESLIQGEIYKYVRTEEFEKIVKNKTKAIAKSLINETINDIFKECHVKTYIFNRLDSKIENKLKDMKIDLKIGGD